MKTKIKQLNTICMMCKGEGNIVFRDYCPKSKHSPKAWPAFHIDICYDCYIFCFPDEKNKFKQCECGQPYMKNEDWQSECLSCWRERKNARYR